MEFGAAALRHRRNLPPSNLSLFIGGEQISREACGFWCLKCGRCVAGLTFRSLLLFPRQLASFPSLKMPVPLLAELSDKGITRIPYVWDIIKLVPWLAVLYLLKIYFSGAKSKAERLMHSKVVLITVRSLGRINDFEY